MKNHLIIVESPSKIKTLKKFLDSKYSVEASVGHIRDLPKSNLGIDVAKDFSAEYNVSPNSVKTVKALKSALKKADELLIATDPDREGEAIAWHIVDELKPKIPVKRLVFNEITKTAILEALEKTRVSLSDAQGGGGNLSGFTLKGAAVGFNKDSQFNVFEQDGNLVFFRSVNGVINIIIGAGGSGFIDVITNDYEGVMQFNDGDGIEIYINQSN